MTTEETVAKIIAEHFGPQCGYEVRWCTSHTGKPHTFIFKPHAFSWVIRASTMRAFARSLRRRMSAL